MIDFQRVDTARREEYAPYLRHAAHRGCNYSFANLVMWGRQRAAVVAGFLVIFSQFDRRAVYSFPMGPGDPRPALDAIMADARERGIPCCLGVLAKEDCDTLEALYPGRFRFHADRDSFDYVYDIQDLAELRGRKFQRKRNHLHRFRDAHPDCRAEPITPADLPAVRELTESWFAQRLAADPLEDFHLERLALKRAFEHYEALGLEGLALWDGGRLIAMTMASFLSEDTVDVHFEKARLDAEGAYNAINFEFARYLRQRYPALRWLDREDDMGLEGLRKAKLSYNPARMVEKYWARLWEDCDDL